jgi:ubiquinone/menaquinone biosynthesis C-methylase UbiE
MSFKLISKVPLLHEVLCRLARWRVAEKLDELVQYLESTDNIVDVGSGNSVLCHELRTRNYKVIPLDIDNQSFIDSVKPVIYDGVKAPFKDNCFDVALLITVLHHTKMPEQVLAEVVRVSKRIIIIEEIYSNAISKYLTYFIDSVFNFEFFGHPRTNKTDAGWRETFERLRLRLVDANYTKSILVLNRVTYVLEKL